MRNFSLRGIASGVIIILCLVACEVHGQVYRTADGQKYRTREGVELKNEEDKQAALDTPYLTRQQAYKIQNKAFGNIAATTTGNSGIANYAAFDPVAGSFTLKGSIPIGKNGKYKVSKISYLNLSFSGDLIGSSYASLFSNSSLNTGISINATFLVNISNVQPRPFTNEFTQLKIAYTQYENEKKFADSVVSFWDQDKVDSKIYTVDLKIKVQDTLMVEAKYEMDRIQYELSKALAAPVLDEAKVKALNDSLNTFEKSIEDFRKTIVSLHQKKDSLSIVAARYGDINGFVLDKSTKEMRKKMDSALLAMKLPDLPMRWLAIGGGVGRQKYTTYNPVAVFGQQLTPDIYNTFEFTVSHNKFYADYLKNTIRYSNIGVSWYRTNNIALLSTTEVVDQKKVVGGDTTRTITKKYNAYTDPIVDTKAFKIFYNLYYLFGERPSGFHIFPEINFQADKFTVVHFGLGYAVSFINTKKDQPVVNAEAYVKFLDLFNHLQSDTKKFWNRNEIGINFSFPINFFTK